MGKAVATKPKKGRAEYNVTADEFIRVWETSNSADEVAQKLNMPKPIVHARASGYRQAGVKLKRMPRHGKAIDVASLNAIIDEVRKNKGITEPPPGTELGQEQVQDVVQQVLKELDKRQKKS